MAEQKYRKLTINVSYEIHEELAERAEARGITVTDLIKRAIALDKYVWEHRDGKLLIEEGGVTRQIVLVG